MWAAGAESITTPAPWSDLGDLLPERLVDAPCRASWTTRLARAGLDGSASLLLNAAVVGFLAYIGWPDGVTRPAPQTISVEIVHGVPGEGKDTKAGPDATSSAKGEPAPSLSAQKPATALPADKVAEPAPPEPAPKPDSQDASPASPKPPVPAPLAAPNDDPGPHLVEAPPAPHQAVTQADRNIQANAVAEPPTDQAPQPSPPPPPRPDALQSPEGADALPLSGENTEKVEPTPEQKRQAENTAKLAAALPFSPTFATSPFRSILSGSGQAAADSYRGAVYGAFRKADDIVEQARERNLHGQAVVAFSIDDHGALTSLAVAVSSGNPEVDEAALAIIRRSAPFPPPPPGGQHVFSPAIALGVGP